MSVPRKEAHLRESSRWRSVLSTAAAESSTLPRAANLECELSPQPESLVLELLRNIRADVARVDDKI